MKILFKKDGNLHIFNLGKTSNKKIFSDSKTKIVQTYTFSLGQYEQVLNQVKDAKGFYGKADSNCLDCPMREYGKCYTHKYMQTMGFLSMLKSVVKVYPTWDSIPELTESIHNSIVELSVDRYVRFGSYGEPVLHGIDLVSDIADVSKSWTGYTHQWKKFPKFADYFMASTHSEDEEKQANQIGWRSFVTVSSSTTSFVNCPASKEGGNKTSCDKCGLCSGRKGKGEKSIFILEH